MQLDGVRELFRGLAARDLARSPKEIGKPSPGAEAAGNPRPSCAKQEMGRCLSPLPLSPRSFCLPWQRRGIFLRSLSESPLQPRGQRHARLAELIA
jgi:hypothetical protein